MNSVSPRNVKATLDVVAACLKHRVRFVGSPGVLMFDFNGLDKVLGELADDYLVLGLDTFTLDGLSVQPRLDYYTDFGDGISPGKAVEAVAGWPRDENLWVEVVLSPR